HAAAEAGRLGEVPGIGAEAFRQVDADGLGASALGEIARGAAEAGAEIEEAPDPGPLHQVRQLVGRLTAARMQLVESREVRRRQGATALGRRRELENAGGESAGPGIVLRNPGP